MYKMGEQMVDLKISEELRRRKKKNWKTPIIIFIIILVGLLIAHLIGF